LNIITIDKNNVDYKHICCAIGNDKVNISRANTKKEWLKQRFDEGLVFKRFSERGKFFIEYMPIEKVWKPITGKNYMVINCLWVAGRFKGKGLGQKLLNECIIDSKALGKNGVCVVSSKRKMGFLTGKKIFIKHGFETCDRAYPYFELLVKRFDEDSMFPKFTSNAKEGVFEDKTDFSIIFSNQCPFMEEYSELMAKVCEERGMSAEIIKLKSSDEAQQFGSPFGTFGVYYKGKFIHHEPMPEKKFNKYIDKILSG